MGLKGWGGLGAKKMGWAPLGITEGDSIFMGGVGYWSVNLRTNLVIVTFPNATWEDFNKVPGWKAEVDEIEAAAQKAEETFKLKLKEGKRLLGSSDAPAPSAKRCRT